MPDTKKRRAVGDSNLGPLKIAGQPFSPLALHQDIPSITSLSAMKNTLSDGMIKQFCQAFENAMQEHAALQAYIIGAGMAFDPLPLEYNPTFVDDDRVAMALDKVMVSGDCFDAMAYIRELEAAASYHIPHPEKSSHGKDRRLSKEA